MTTYNTGNPIGSKDPRDLYDNAENLDEAVNTRQAESWDDRFGVARKTWWGMEQDFQDFLINSGYVNIGDYGPGLEITERNQIFWRDGELYRAGANLALPYTTTGDWGEEEGLFVAVGDQALRQELSSTSVGSSLLGRGVVSVESVSDLISLPENMKRSDLLFMVKSYHVGAGDGGGSFYWDSGRIGENDGGSVINGWVRIFPPYVTFEMFGAVGDFDWDSRTGTVETEKLQAAINFAHNNSYELRLGAGKKYYTESLYLYDHHDNPGWEGRRGRIKITGQSQGHATGALETQGSAIVHVDGQSTPLLSCVGEFSAEQPTGMGGYINMECFNLVGGNMTESVLRIQGSQGGISGRNMTFKVMNPNGNGITEQTTWETSWENILIRGEAQGSLGSPNIWTGVGLDILSDHTDGQINMKIYRNVDCYRMGYGIRIGRRGQTHGTFGPLVFIGGQTSLTDRHGLWLDGGAISFTSIGQQFEGSHLSAIRIDREYEEGSLASDVARNIKFLQTYITGSGAIDDGSKDSFAINIENGDGICFEGTTFNNVGNGIRINLEHANNVKIDRPYVRSVRPYGASSGTMFALASTINPVHRCEIIDPILPNSPLNIYNEVSRNVFGREMAGGLLNITSLNQQPSISRGGAYGSVPFSRINFNQTSPGTVSNFTGAWEEHEILVTFSNTNTTIQHGANIRLQGGSDFTPSSQYSTIRLIYRAGTWREVGRSQNS